MEWPHIVQSKLRYLASGNAGLSPSKKFGIHVASTSALPTVENLQFDPHVMILDYPVPDSSSSSNSSCSSSESKEAEAKEAAKVAAESKDSGFRLASFPRECRGNAGRCLLECGSWAASWRGVCAKASE